MNSLFKETYRAFLAILALTIGLALTFPAGADQRGLMVRPQAPTGEEVKGEQWLLTIGIDSYLSWNRLKTAVNDAKAVKETLLQRYHINPSRIVELYNEQATRKNILHAFRELAKRVKPDDSLLVFYAGHGNIDPVTKEGSWIPVESGTDDPSSWLSNHDIKNYLKIDVIKAKHILLVSDSCFSGDFFRGSRAALPEVNDAMLKKAYQRTSRQAISSGGLEPVSDAGFGGNSVFSYFLVAALKNNSKPYLIPSELFNEVRSGVGKNADQLPQFGNLSDVGGQEGGEMIFFLQQKDKLKDLSADSIARQKELEQLRKTEKEATAARQREQAEISKKEAELAAMDRQIAEMKARLGSGSAKKGDSLDQIIALAEQKEAQGKRLEELRQQREAEEAKRRVEIERLKEEGLQRKAKQLESELAKYQQVASSKYAQDLKGAAWEALIANYPEAKGVEQGDIEGLLKALGLASQATPVAAKIGVISIITGPGAGYGEVITNGFKLAQGELNAKGEVKIDLIMEDSSGKQKQALAAAQKLINSQQVVAILGPTLSTEMKVVGPEANARGVPIMGTSTTAVGITQIGKYVFRNSLPESLAVPAAMKKAVAKYHIKSVAMLYGNDDVFTKLGFDTMKKVATDMGLKITTIEEFQKGQADYKAQLTKIKATNPDAVICSALYQEGAVILSQARKMGINVPFVGGNGFNSPEVINIAKEAANGLIVATPWFGDKDDPKVKAFVQKYQKTYGKKPDQFAAQAYDALYIMGEALKKAGKADRDKLRDALASIRNYNGVLGKFSFDNERDVVMDPNVLIVKDGKFQIFN